MMRRRSRVAANGRPLRRAGDLAVVRGRFAEHRSGLFADRPRLALGHQRQALRTTCAFAGGFGAKKAMYQANVQRVVALNVFSRRPNATFGRTSKIGPIFGSSVNDLYFFA